jgi:hypothetical protein
MLCSNSFPLMRPGRSTRRNILMLRGSARCIGRESHDATD